MANSSGRSTTDARSLARAKWLNDAQFYLDPAEAGLGERVAAGLRELLRDPARAPVLVLATVWPEFWHALTGRPAAGEDRHAQAPELLAGHDITVPAVFTPAQMGRLAQAADARIAFGGEPPVLGIDGLLAVAAVVRRLGGTRAGMDNGGGRCVEMLPCPLSRQAAAVPAWEAFPAVNRVVVSRLLALLVERMVRAAGGSGGERGERRGDAGRGAG